MNELFYRVLLIDDEPDVHQVFRDMLAPVCAPMPPPALSNGVQTSGILSGGPYPKFELDSAYQGEDGVSRVREALTAGRPYAMAFVDLRMPPGIDGLETISRVWRQCFDIQIVICSAHTDFSWEELTRRFGHSDRLLILKKPFDVKEVRQVAYSLAEKWDLAHQAQSHLERLQRLVSERTAKLQKANLSLQRKIIQNQQAERRLLAQYAAGHALAETSSPADALRRILEIVCEKLDWDWGALWQPNTDGNALQLTSHWIKPGASLERFKECSTHAKLPLDADVPGKAWSGSDPVWIPDRRQSPEFPRSAGASQDGVHASVAFPIFVEKDRFGIMEFASREIREHDPDLLQTFSVIAGAVSQFLERKRGEEHRKLMEVQLRHAQKLESIGQLAAGIAHEINTPIQYIGDNIRFLQSSFVDLQQAQNHYEKLLSSLKKETVTPEIQAEIETTLHPADLDFLIAEIPKAIQQTLEGVDRVTRIVRAMKDFSHPGTGDKTPVDLNQALETTFTVARNEWKYVASVETNFDPELPPVPCLPGELNQVFLNLIVNAAHAIADVVAGDPAHKGVITASTRQCGDSVEIRIRDTGGGIPESIRHKIYDPFFTTKPVGKGTGQGLAIAHAVIVEQHGGTLDFETETGVGTVFIVRLPLKPARGPKALPKPIRITESETSFVRR